MTDSTYSVQCRVRVALGEDIALGPGKVDLLAAIAQTGSISAAARQMGMSYRRAWLLVETMNKCFLRPLVQTSTGGRAGGGAALTDEGQLLLSAYNQMMSRIQVSANEQLRELLQQTPLKALSKPD